MALTLNRLCSFSPTPDQPLLEPMNPVLREIVRSVSAGGEAPATPALWIQREDKIDSFCSGAKIRKLAGLVPFLEQNLAPGGRVILTGSPQSNFLVCAVRLFRERGIPYELVLWGRLPARETGNWFWIRALTPREDIFLEPKPGAGRLRYWWKRARDSGGVFLPEGGAHPAAWPGLFGLPLSLGRGILEQMDLGPKAEGPVRVFLDAGTGWSAAAVVAFFQEWGRLALDFHILFVAGGPRRFTRTLEKARQAWRQIFDPIYAKKGPAAAVTWRTLEPATARSFGSVNQRVLGFCRQAARRAGILFDPVYSAKLFLAAQKSLAEHPTRDQPVILVHSGHPRQWMGWTEQLTESSPGTGPENRGEGGW